MQTHLGEDTKNRNCLHGEYVTLFTSTKSVPVWGHNPVISIQTDMLLQLQASAAFPCYYGEINNFSPLKQAEDEGGWKIKFNAQSKSNKQLKVISDQSET